MRVFLDTNVLISAFVARGLCADVLRAVLAEHELVIGAVVIDEIRRVLELKLKVPADLVDEALTVLEDAVVVPRPGRPEDAPIADLDDMWVLASAQEGRAEILVTGDTELVQLGEWSGIPIRTPRAFWEVLTRGVL